MAPDITATIDPVEISGHILKNLSPVNGEATATGKYKAKIVGITAVCSDGANEYPLISGQTIPIFGSHVQVIIRAVDDRGLMAEYSEELQVLNYYSPGILSATAVRCDADGSDNDDGEYVRCQMAGMWYRLPDKSNVARAYVIVKRLGGSSIYGEPFDPEQTCVMGNGMVDKNAAWNAEFTLEDGLGGRARYTVQVPSGKVFMVWEPDKNAIGFGQRPEGSNRLQLGNDWELIYKGKTIDNAYQQKNLVTTVDESSDDKHYPSAAAVQRALEGVDPGIDPSMIPQIRMGTADYPALGAQASSVVDITFNQPFPDGYDVYVTAQPVPETAVIHYGFVVCLCVSSTSSGCRIRVYNTRTSALSTGHAMVYMAVGIPGNGTRMMNLEGD